MVQITSEMVRELRERTGAGMMDCKKALASSNGDMDAAVHFLREKGLAAAQKKAGRVAAEGLVGILVRDGVAAMAELNCETDFVARNPDFQQLVNQLTEQIALSKDLRSSGETNGEALSAMPFIGDHSRTTEEVLKSKTATIGERISLRRFVRFQGGHVYGSYVHSGGSIGVVVELQIGQADKAKSDQIAGLAKDLAMHVAAANPRFLNRSEVDQATLAVERQIFTKQVLDQGKPENIVQKIVDGKIEKFYTEACLLEQPFVKDPDQSIQQVLAKTAKDLGTEATILRFARFKVGEGIEKKSDDFASEVAKMTGL